ncbi:MAG: hypothetical protein LBT20_03065, partial [Clostridiales bacterium]|nr:hypothetical protein [Clostridiales bacterium]
MKILYCQSNIDSFFTAVYESYYAHRGAQAIRPFFSARSFLDEAVEIGCEPSYAEKVKIGIVKKLGKSGLEEIFLAYRSGNPNKESIIY